VLLFSATLFLSAFLLFTVELIVAKAVLPALGGVPMVWNTCMVFFQVTLLAGYLYAHGATAWLGPRRHVLVYVTLVAMPLVFLPLSTMVSDPPPQDGSPIAWLMLVLVGWVGLPFFVLSTSAAVLQHWFAHSDEFSARDPYFLYAASNLGSMLALIAYPTLVEPAFRLRDQSQAWSMGYVIFVLVAWACAFVEERGCGSRGCHDR
jgi:dipeptide/tripeptide permease